MDKTSHSTKQIGSRNDADDLAPFDDRNPLDIMTLHELHDVF